jgi:hypothetical protein
VDVGSEIIAFWGAGRLHRWREEVVCRTRLSASTRKFLVEVGLPAVPPGIGAHFEIPSIAGLLVDWDPLLRREPVSWTIRLNKYNDIAIDVRNDDRVISPASPGGVPAGIRPHPERLFNATVAQFALSLTEYYKAFYGFGPYIHEEEGTKSFDEIVDRRERNFRILEQELKNIDASAFENEENAWTFKILCDLNYY